jgi:hypothetical protein
MTIWPGCSPPQSWRAQSGSRALGTEGSGRAAAAFSERSWVAIWSATRARCASQQARTASRSCSTIREGRRHRSNLSHSGELALYAFTTSGPVGVDVEVARRPISTLALAERSFGREAAERLENLDPERREQEFLGAWVRHEAALKLSGRGLGAADPAAQPARRAPWIAELEIGGLAAAAIALDGAPSELRCWDWL